MLSPDLKVAVRSAAELLHRSHRLREHFDRIGPGESGEHRRLVETMRRALEDIEDTLVRSLAELWQIVPEDGRAKVTNPAPGDDSLPAQAVGTLLLTLRGFSRRFVTIHESLVYLPWQSIEPELVFSLAGCFPDFWKQHQPSMVMGSLFNAFEFDFIKILKEKLPDIGEVFSEEERNFVLMFAICDAHSPLACAILAHEVGHAIDAEHGISRTVASKVVAAPWLPPHTRLNWCKEICADLIAAQMVGPAPVLSVVSMEYCLYPSHMICRHGRSHPSTHARLRILADAPGQSTATAPLPSELDLYQHAWRLNLEREFPDAAERQEQEREHDFYMKNLLFPMAAAVRERFSFIDPPLQSISFDEASLTRCEKRLRLGSPVSAQGGDPESLARRVEEHRHMSFETEEARREMFKKLSGEFAEMPVEVPRILLSGYRHRSNVIDSLYNEDGPLGTEQSVTRFCDSLAALDRLMGGSIVNTCVHKEVLRLLEANRL